MWEWLEIPRIAKVEEESNPEKAVGDENGGNCNKCVFGGNRKRGNKSSGQ